jgi:cobalamin biosynthesis Mg chelatase CobN
MRASQLVLRSLITHRVVRLGLVLVGLVVLSGLGSKTAVAKTPSCADQVIADWYDDGRISKIYPLACYRAAIAKLPPDVLDYSNAKEEIGRALAFAKQGKPDPGSEDPTPSTSTSTTTSSSTTTSKTTKTTKTSTTKTTRTQTTDTQTEAAGDTSTDTSGPSSVPVPLLVLGGLAVLLLAAGSAGYLRRRMGGEDDGDGSPPAAA